MDLQGQTLLDRDGLIAIDKPAGLPSTGRDTTDRHCLQGVLMAHHRRRIWAVHQLDADTTGVNLFVRQKALVSVWSERLKQARKRYVGICHGVPKADRFVIDEPIGWVEGLRRRAVAADGQRARTQVRVRARGDGVALLDLAIQTGRSHQIRIHLSHIGHPLIGERRYRSPACDRHPRHALHAAAIEWPNDRYPRLEAPVPADLHALGARLGVSLDR